MFNLCWGGYYQAVIEKAISKIFPISIDLFVMITGYFLTTGKVKYKRLISLWLQVCFYSVGIYLIFCITGELSFDFKTLIKRFLPILSTEYWFFTTYFFLYLIAPFLCAMVNNISKKQHLAICVAIIILTLLIRERKILGAINIGDGYNLFWFICLFIIGSCLSKIDIKIKWWGYLTLVAVLGVFTITLIYNKLTSGYTSFANVVMAIIFFYLFKNIKIKNKWLNKFILIISSATFGVYLIHDNNYMRSVLYTKIFNCPAFYAKPYAAFAMLGCVLITYIACVVVELLRKFLFSCIKKSFIKIRNKRNGNIEQIT